MSHAAEPIDPPRSMTVDEFEAWYRAQPEDARYELLDGEVIRMQSERVAHGLVKTAIAGQFLNQVAARGLPCDVFGDGMAIPHGDRNWFEPDALLRCGDPLDPDQTRVADPLIIVEVTSPSTSRLDTNEKFDSYFAASSLAHYVVVVIARRAVIAHTRRGDQIFTQVSHTGALTLDPPGIALDLDALWAVLDRIAPTAEPEI